MDSILGRDISVPYTYDSSCPKCGGTGAATPSDVHTCSHCGGSGFVKVQKRTMFGAIESQEVCPTCGGTGKVITNKCENCHGSGFVKTKIDLKVHIPAGISNGQQIRVSGKGERGVQGGPNGDLYIEIVVKPHSLFERDGNDIKIELPIDFVDVCLGVQAEVPTVYGNVMVNIPAGTQPETTIRMKGCGVKDIKTQKPGDEYLKIKVMIPSTLTKEQKQLLEAYKSGISPKESWLEKFKKKFK